MTRGGPRQTDSSMKCPACSGHRVGVVAGWQRKNGWEIARRRLCNDCGLRFRTVEVIATLPIVEVAA